MSTNHDHKGISKTVIIIIPRPLFIRTCLFLFQDVFPGLREEKVEKVDFLPLELFSQLLKTFYRNANFT